MTTRSDAAMPASATSGAEPWHAGITWNGVVLLALACLANALIHKPFDLPQWPLFVAGRFVRTSVLVAVTVLAVIVTINRVPRAPHWRYPALVLAVLTSTAAASATTGIVRLGWPAWLADVAETGGFGWWLWGILMGYGVTVLLCAAVFVFYRIREEHEAATREAEVARARSEQQMDEARLAMLQAQIEPHFLFNTLANVRRLYEIEPFAGESMLDNLMRYLAVALPQMRAAESTFGREAALAEAYLNVQRTRMGPRLAFEIDVPDSLRDATMPPLMLLTLVENAIKHGIGPLREGGRVRISVRRDGNRVELKVADTGQGFTRTSGGGTGLANTRARLAALHGEAASLGLAQNMPHGVVATIVLPLVPALRSAATR
jgi:signal transduction histidine kinase